MKRYIKPMKRRVMASVSGNGTVTLKDTNTDVMPVVDFGTYGGMLSWALEDVFDYDAVNLEAFEGSEYYDEVAQLIGRCLRLNNFGNKLYFYITTSSTEFE